MGERYACDWSGENATLPAGVFLPRSTADVARIVALCQQARQPLVVQGGLTGLSGGATPQAGEWSLSTERLNEIFASMLTARRSPSVPASRCSEFRRRRRTPT